VKLLDESKTQNQSLNEEKILSYGFLISFAVLFILFILVLHWTSSDVRATCKRVQQQFEGDPVEAIVAYLESDSGSFKEKNRVIWALGEIGDKRALPVLQKLYAGVPCSMPCDSSKYICQYGLEKAIRACKGFNVVRYVWQWIRFMDCCLSNSGTICLSRNSRRRSHCLKRLKSNPLLF